MNRTLSRRAWLSVCLLPAAITAGCHTAGWQAGELCKACQRPVHRNSRTVALLDGKRAVFCCPACARSEHVQSAKTVQIVELTDFNTGKPLATAGAYVVRNSDVNPCTEHTHAPGPDKRPMQTTFDRCSPGELAFAGKSEAEAFARQHGGQVIDFATLAR